MANRSLRARFICLPSTNHTKKLPVIHQVLTLDTSPRWRVFYTTARAEKKVEERLIERGIEVFLPKMIVQRQWKDRKKKVVEPLFPNYIFAHVDERDRLRVLETQGIVRTVSFSGKPAELSSYEVEQLLITQRDPERLSLLLHPLPEIGEFVEIKEGPLRGLRGEVIDVNGNLYVVLRVQAVRQNVRVRVQTDWIGPIVRERSVLRKNYL